MQPLSGVKRNKLVITGGLGPVMPFAAGSEFEFDVYAVSNLRKSPIPSSTNISERCLTIFYAGTVNVYDDVPQAKAEAIMKLAAAHVARDDDENPPPVKERNNYVMCARNSSLVPDSPISLHGDDGENQEFAKFLQPCHTSVPTALRLARKASLAQFLQRRKARLMAFYSLKERCLSSGNEGNMIKAQGADTNAVSFGLARMEREEIGRVMENDANGFGTASRISNGAAAQNRYFTEEASKHYNHKKKNVSEEEEEESACSTTS